MGLSNCTRVQLQQEEINHPDDLAEFCEKEMWDKIIENSKRLPQVANATGVLADQQTFQIAVKSLLRLRIAARVVDYYD